MRWHVVESYEEMSRKAAAFFIEALQENPRLVLGLATGSTPVGTYQELIRAFREGKISFQQAFAVNLDEYAGLPPDHPQSYAYFMESELFAHVDMPSHHRHIPKGLAPDLDEECRRYEEVIADLGGVDVQLLGIGVNGHIGFNEPGTPFDARTHVVELTSSTRQANARFFDSLEEVPTHAITMGLGTIREARHILLLASGPSKREAIQALRKGEPDPQWPATCLWLHDHVDVMVDREAYGE
ncbi:MAG: glucosamine-6-phosphate deaminase [Bacillota bacterium]|nr:glucosamine-6-phosphate deaminase [Bacillota bacterium]